MKKKICFVIMGFGKKTDPSTGKTFDLDKTYKNIIQPAVLLSEYECVRADEIQDSGIIDKSMYALLIQSDLVIADISTYNPNAIYELGIRHAVKPFSTIVIKEEEGKLPFDLDHTRTFKYSHLGEDIGTDEAKRCVKDLSDLINVVSKNQNTDSPLYEYFSAIQPPKLSDEEFNAIITELADKEKHIFAIVENAKKLMSENDFINAYKYWDKASKIIESETFFIQQKALCRYKSKEPSEQMSLSDALNIIEDLLPSNDPETLGITGSIYKRLYLINKDIEFLNRAIDNYGKGWKISENYYTGENYAFCLNMKSSIIDDAKEKIYCEIEAQKTRENIVKNLEEIIIDDNFENRIDLKWIYASLANCYYILNRKSEVKDIEEKFYEVALDWEKETYKSSKNQIKQILNL
ncbi:tetratricopeptide repeat-containing protein [Flavobacterium sp. UBA7663]|uniref:tetratricopeptide repeat-containing protein n=1 Tax=Flavobacterium sp. UBA7663 TaxID=1946557 RepID=UPI0025C70C3A|nr:tetratricopeptide repeat-containing protein [Flavobacterium sp. UBA7663]